MHIKLTRLALILFVPMLVVTNVRGEDAEACYKQSLEFIKKQQYDDAIAQATKAIKQKPKYWEAYVVRGAAHAEKRELDEAIADFTEVIRLNPKDPTGYRNRSIAYSNKGEKEKALADLTEAKRLETK
jgi:tetratricopeptide (TPR) repeat protein